MPRIILALSLISVLVASTIAQPPQPPPPLQGILLSPPPGTELPPPPPEPPTDPEAGKMMLFEGLFALMDTDGDGKISKDEMLAWLADIHFPVHGGGESSGISEGDDGLEDLPHPVECSESVITSEMQPQDTNISCSSSESKGNLVHRTVCNTDPYKSQAISLPDGRAADCFRIAAIKGHNIVFEIIKESDGTQMFHTSMGKTAFDRLILIGEPGDTVYRINLISADEPDASITVEHIDHPQF